MLACIPSGLVISTSRTGVDIGASANLELLDKFCNLGNMLSLDGEGTMPSLQDCVFLPCKSLLWE